ncbi:MAG: hypothetical protein R3E32_20260 [Chitinophagales bacterium]
MELSSGHLWEHCRGRSNPKSCNMTSEKAVVRFLTKLLNHSDKAEKQQLISNFKNELDELFQNPTEKRVFSYLDLRLWIDKEDS